MDEFVVKAVELSKYYGSFLALNKLNVNFERGKVIGLLGPNGSGKTTFIKILAGLLTASEGKVYIDGKEPGEETKAIVSYLPERTYFNSWMKVNECITYFEDFYADFDRKLAEKMLSELGVTLDAKLKTLSKGTKEKVQLVLVMARNAQLYLLDEPIAGVDPVAREYILKTIISNHRPDSAIIISTHLISDIEDVLDRFLFIHRGKIIVDDDVESVKNEKGMSIDRYFREVFRCS